MVFNHVYVDLYILLAESNCIEWGADKVSSH